ncbi:PREDICTED: uncharacterized protein LOC105458838 [Wasmannia auropunctata]|uniref:uncharacterized protein LOC105458838 n=1 Tax=Wasmannia auropunctata TaxID=64793 RepID=UPI0005EEEE94|nr:PREDICTED: uncharacterized protein LOC105458838 [Wasmannia auropunctata]
MMDCITIFNSACIACVWCILFSVCFPRFSKNLRKVDSSECCVRRRQTQKHGRVRSHDPRCVRNGLQSVHPRRRLKDSPCFERNREDQQKCRSCRKREKICVRSGECRNVRLCTEKNRETSRICNRLAEHSNSYKSDDSLNKKNNTDTDLKAEKSDYSVCKRS